MFLAITSSTNQLIVNLSTLLASITIIYVKYWLEKRKYRKIKRIRDFELDGLIYGKLSDILLHTQADRAYILEYGRNSHIDGDVNSLKNINRVSITYEVVAPGTSSEQQNYQNTTMTGYSEMFNSIIDKGGIFVEDVYKMADSDPTKDIYLKKGNKSVYAIAMYNLERTLVGMLNIDYVRKETLLQQEVFDYFKLAAEHIAGYM